MIIMTMFEKNGPNNRSLKNACAIQKDIIHKKDCHSGLSGIFREKKDSRNPDPEKFRIGIAGMT
ncbi:MAG: hypothetical protein Q8K68_07525, partial [Nitrospirota bacterium]|nr:hypothetical protein [Nitrospirota bacterium]